MNEITKRETVEDLVQHYKRICRETTAAYKLLERAQSRLRASIYEHGHLAPDRHHYCDFDEQTLGVVLNEVKKSTWRGIVARLGVRGIMDSTRRYELDKQLETGEGLPEIETEAILTVILGMASNAEAYMEGAIKEAFEMIRQKSEGFKSTGQEWQIKDKAVLTWMVEPSWYKSGKFQTRCRANDDILCIENAFRLLDGKGPHKGHGADLAGEINSSPDGAGETDYFRFRSHKNGNLHVWFKRPDLVTELNAVAGGARVLRRAS
jgi:hypothetical protein